jgi:exonuclease VII small subunit
MGFKTIVEVIEAEQMEVDKSFSMLHLGNQLYQN